METLYIVIAVVIGVVIVVFILRDRITRFFARVADHEIGVNAAPPGRRERRQAATRVKGNRMVGKRQQMRVRQTDVEVDRNVMRGEDQELEVGPGQPSVGPEPPPDSQPDRPE